MTWQADPVLGPQVAMLPGVERAAATLFPAGRIPDPDEVHSAAEFSRYRDQGLLWAIADGGQVSGFVMARELDRALHVDELAVDPRFGRRGIGTALMRRVLDEARERRLPRVTLTTFEDLPWNAPFYQRLGFRILADPELSPPLRQLLDRERAVGMERRVAMMLNTAGPA